ncbi:MAG: aminoacyl-tRNA hydrolase [Candidatus Gracilibacteria bacterium]|nr:aminoacyl-tRNA hydrolase [Candidatus Gracilibacteria bacterium]
MKIIVGLGNPGNQYRETRHNVGFLMAEFLRSEWDFSDFSDSNFEALIAEKNISGEKILLVKPMTFMNLSGNAVSKIMNFYKIPLENLLVISDDIDMDFGKIRLREKGSHGGQNGLRDIIAKLGTDEFARLKIGIGRDERFAVADWVLSKFSSDEKNILQTEIFPEALVRVQDFLEK